MGAPAPLFFSCEKWVTRKGYDLLKKLLNPHLWIDPADLFSLMYNITRDFSADQKWRVWVMVLHVLQYDILICIRVTIPAEMPAGVVCSNVSGEIAGAFFSAVGIWRNQEVLPDCRFKCSYSHAAGAIRTEGFKRFTFTARLDDHAMLFPDFYKSRSDGYLVIHRDSSCFREVALYFLIQVDKTDDAGMCETCQFCRHM